jgi:hypothetical protein
VVLGYENLQRDQGPLWERGVTPWLQF